MLVLTRKRHEQIQIGDDITVHVIGINSGRVRIGIDAPGDVAVHRVEIAGAISGEHVDATGKATG